MDTIKLDDTSYPMVDLFDRLDLLRVPSPFGLQDMRIILLNAQGGELALRVDKILSKQLVKVQPIEADQKALCDKVATIEKSAYILEMDRF